MSEDILICTLDDGVADHSLAYLDIVAWDLATVLCRRCWHPLWSHGHGPFKNLIDHPATHLFDAL